MCSENVPLFRDPMARHPRQDALADYVQGRREIDALAESGPQSTGIHPQYVTRLVSQLAAEDAVFTATWVRPSPGPCATCSLQANVDSSVR
jgi:hypothetical protein